MRPRLGAVVAGLAVPLCGAAQEISALRIEHAAVECVVAGQHTEITACFDPDAMVAQARVFFRARADRHWYYVKMAPKAACRSAFLPKPRKSAQAIHYYVESATRDFAVTRTDEHEAQIRGRDACATPAVAKAAVAVSSLAGGPAVPLGFGAATTPAVIGVLGAGAAVGGGIAIVNNGGGGTTSTLPATSTRPGSSTTTVPGATTTTMPGATTTLPGTTTTTTLPGTTTTTITSTTAPGCTDTTHPQTAILVPTNGLVVTLTTPVVATATDNVGVTRVEFDVDGDRITTLTSPPFTILWNTLTVSNGSHVLTTRAFDACGNSQTSNGVNVTVVNLLVGSRGDTGLVTSELRLTDSVAQLVVGRQAAHFLREGTSMLAVPRVKGELWLELTVVQGAGRPGEWRVALPDAGRALVRVLAGEVLALEPGAVIVRLRGVEGERVVLSLAAE